MELPNLYVLHSAPVIGTFIAPTSVEVKKLCDQCNAVQLPKLYSNIYLETDTWNGENIIQAESVFIVSDRLKNVIQEKNITGCSFEKVKISKSPYFYVGSNFDFEEMPQFWSLKIHERYKGPEIWWKNIPCEKCEKSKWNITLEGIVSISFPFNKDPIAPRTVFRDSWKGADIFYLEDPDVPIITEKLANVFKEYSNEVNLLNSGWA